MSENFRAGLALSVALVLSSGVASWSFIHSKRLNQTIDVTGSAKKRIKSDYIIWRAAVTVESPSLADGYAKLSRDVEKTKTFLVAQGVPENQIVISAVVTTPIRPQPQRTYQGMNVEVTALSGKISGYSLKQTLEIRSTDIDKISAVSRQVTQLIT